MMKVVVLVCGVILVASFCVFDSVKAGTPPPPPGGGSSSSSDPGTSGGGGGGGGCLISVLGQ